MHHTLEETCHLFGNATHEAIRLGLEQAGLDDAEPVVNRIEEIFHPYYVAHCNIHTKPYEGVTELVERLKEKDIRCAVVSNKGDTAANKLAQTHFGDLFEIVVGNRKDIRRKPAPDAVLKVLETMGIAAQEAVYIGDTEVDFATAQAAGCDCICVTWGFRTVDELFEIGATTIVETMEELEEKLYE